MSKWSDAAAWSGDGLRREVFFFGSGGVDLYGSLFAAARPSRRYGVLAFSSWGVEADRSDPLARFVALAMARHGGAGMVFHYPGYGDSYGDLAALTLDDLSRAAVDASAEASRRCPDLDWIFAGFMFGASVACLAQAAGAAEHLLLVQPELRPGDYFERLSHSRGPLAPGPSPRQMMEAGSTPGMAYGYPIPRRIAGEAGETDAAVAAALTAFGGGGAVVRHVLDDEPDPAPERLERIEVPGAWRFGSQNHPELAGAAGDWLDRYTAGNGSGD
jgi:hypothetical protein